MMSKRDGGTENIAGSSASETALEASIVADVKSYCGKDPLLPWLRGIKKVEESLPQSEIPEKLPLFLLRCVQEFESHGRYSNDLRYIRVWLKLMDCIDDPIHLLKKMEANGIGIKTSLYYRALALYYEKKKNYKEAEKIYHIGIQIKAEPVEELTKSLQQFVGRMQRHNNKKNMRNNAKRARNGEERKRASEDDTVVIKFVGKTVVENPQVEDACHHGLLDPTINMKEAMNAINNMFRAPMASAFVRKRKPRQDKKKADDTSFSVLGDEEDSGQPFFILKDDQTPPPSGHRTLAAHPDFTDLIQNSQLSTLPHLPLKDDLCEPTMCTIQAIRDINNMFAMPMD